MFVGEGGRSGSESLTAYGWNAVEALIYMV